jgi:hypothetical protein
MSDSDEWLEQGKLDRLQEDVEAALAAGRQLGTPVAVWPVHLERMLSAIKELQGVRAADVAFEEAIAKALEESKQDVADAKRCEICRVLGEARPDGSVQCNHCWSASLRAIPG